MINATFQELELCGWTPLMAAATGTRGTHLTHPFHSATIPTHKKGLSFCAFQKPLSLRFEIENISLERNKEISVDLKATFHCKSKSLFPISAIVTLRVLLPALHL
ncbi:hypothetical protein Csa_019255 [Cucumis sativus]|uniref:Uncharacterized protein n=1 Tax=Cucumis sativus TaxID=3659 RepID=A0A0A0LF06_CUCSA|nr:hypothetical protein Csa_019255 [Cucumis sativus]